MTTTKEDQIRAEFESVYLGNNKHAARRNELGDYVLPSIQDAWAGYKACAESCEKKLAEANTRIARLVEAIKPFAQNVPEDYEAPCHSGITSARKCGRCSRAYEAYQAITANSEAVAEYEREVKTAAKVGLLNWLYECGYLTEEAEKLHQSEQLRAANSEAVATTPAKD